MSTPGDVDSGHGKKRDVIGEGLEVSLYRRVVQTAATGG